MKYMIPLIFSGFLSLGSAMADEPPATPAPTLPATGKTLSPTQQWLELQRSGKAASAHPQPLSGEAMDHVHNRYLKSFEQPIPEFYEREKSTTR